MRQFRAVLFGLVLGAANLVAAAPQPWAFVESVGGIKVGDPVQADGVWSLPVQADVSGLETFTSKPTALHSALVCSSVVAKIIDNSIYLTIHSNLVGVARSARCPAARLGIVTSGAYEVFYKGPQEAPVLLRSVRVTDKSASVLSLEDQQAFDASRAVILQGEAARDLAEMCGAQTGSKMWEVAPTDIKNLEQELAPLLAADLKRAGSDATPHQYYRQYAAGQFEKLDAIFINGFHESYMSSFNDASWRSHVVDVSDGGDRYWCAIYVKGLKRHFVIYKERRQGDGDTHVNFHGVA